LAGEGFRGFEGREPLTVDWPAKVREIGNDGRKRSFWAAGSLEEPDRVFRTGPAAGAAGAQRNGKKAENNGNGYAEDMARLKTAWGQTGEIEESCGTSWHHGGK